MQGLAFPRAPDVGVVGLALPGLWVGAWVVGGGGGGVVGGNEGVGAVYGQVASWCVVVGGGEGVVYVVHEGHVSGGGWLLVVRRGDVSWDVVPEVAQASSRPMSPSATPWCRWGWLGGGWTMTGSW